MALDFNSNEIAALAKEGAEDGSVELSSDDILAPTCMFWAMVIGLVIMGGFIIIWIAAGLGQIFS